MFSFRDVVYNKATDDFTVSVKDLKRDIVMDGERLVIVNLISLQPLLLLHDQDDDDHHHYPQVRLRGGRLRPLLGAQRAHIPRRREVPRQGSSCPRLQVSFIEPLSSSSQLSSFPPINIPFASVQRISNPQGCHRVCWKATSSGWLKLFCRRHRSSMSQVIQLITILTIEYPSTSLICP